MRNTSIWIAAGTLVGGTLLLLDPPGRHLAWNSLALLVGTLLLAVPGGVFLALALTRTRVPGRRMAWALLVASVLLPLYFHAAGWLAWLGPFGWLGSGGTWPWGSRLLGSVWVHGLYGMAWVALLVAGAACTLNPHLELQAWMWRSPSQVLWQVDVPAVVSSVAAAAAWVATTTLAEITVSDLFQLRTFAEEFYLWMSLTAGTEEVATTVSRTWPAWVWATGGALLVAHWIQKDLLATWAQSRFAAPVLRWGRGQLFFSTLAWALVLLIAVVPVVALLRQAGTEVFQMQGHWVRRWSLEQLALNVAESLWRCRQAIGYSALTALAAAMIALGLGAALARWSLKKPWWVWSLGAVLLATPGPLLAWAIITLANRPECPWLVWLYDRTLLAPIALQTLRSLGLMLWLAWALWATVPQELREQAQVLGLGPWETFWRLEFPLRWPGLVLAFLAAWLMAWNELSGTLLVLPPGVDTLPRQLFGLLHARVEDQVAAVCLVLFAASFALGLVLTTWASRHWQKQWASGDLEK